MVFDEKNRSPTVFVLEIFELVFRGIGKSHFFLGISPHRFGVGQSLWEVSARQKTLPEKSHPY